jgi:hypothetical protein
MKILNREQTDEHEGKVTGIARSDGEVPMWVTGGDD